MVDGTLRLTVDISPLHAQAGFALFGMPDEPIVLARLTQKDVVQKAQNETIQEAELNGGFVSQWLTTLCQEPKFWDFVEANFINGGKMTTCNNAHECDVWVKQCLGIISKKELDNDKEAEKRFQDMIRLPYLEWRLKNAE